MAILIRNLDKRVYDFILDKQHEFKKEKGRMVSLGSTIERLLKEVLLKDVKEKK